jgi:hypothetical protein
LLGQIEMTGMAVTGGWRWIAQELIGTLPVMVSIAARLIAIETGWMRIESGAETARQTGIMIVMTRMIILTAKL